MENWSEPGDRFLNLPQPTRLCRAMPCRSRWTERGCPSAVQVASSASSGWVSDSG